MKKMFRLWIRLSKHQLIKEVACQPLLFYINLLNFSFVPVNDLFTIHKTLNYHVKGNKLRLINKLVTLQQILGMRIKS